MVFPRFRNLSIKNKLTFIIIFSCLFVSLMASVFLAGRDIISLRRSTIEDLSGLAKVIGINCTAPLEFLDPDTGDEILSSLSARPQILQALLYTPDGRIFSQYHLATLSSLEAEELRGYLNVEKIFLHDELYHFYKNHIDLSVHIGETGKRIGVIVLQADQKEFRAILFRLLCAILVLTTVTLLLSFFFSSILNKIVSNPILALVDITERICREEDYALRVDKNAEDELGVLVLSINSMLDGIQQRDNQLLIAKKIAEDANQAKSQFLAQMSHEIRTPMNGVLGIVSLLLNTALDEKQNRFVHTIRRSGESLLNLINDILDFSKIEAGKMELELVSFNLREHAEETVDFFSQHAQEKNINLGCFIHSSVPVYIIGDPQRLRQILTNLLSNAVKFTRDGDVSLCVTVAETGVNGTHLHFEVKDTGCGISPKSQNEIFSAFSQEDISTTRKYGGTGLGLAICRELIYMMGGEINVESVKDEGSTFWFIAIFALGNWDETTEESKDQVMTSGMYNVSVLVAEDNSTNQIVAQGVLEQFGCNVDVVDNGNEAVIAASRKDYALIFMDCQMPVMDGYVATKEIRNGESLRGDAQTPIVALTAHAMKGDREHCLAVGMDDYLTKPFKEQQLATILSKWLGAVERKPLLKEREEQEVKQSHFDRTVLDDYRKMQKVGEPDIRKRIINTYLKSSPLLIKDLQQAAESDDLENLWQSAHSLKSSSASLGADHLSFLCHKLEVQGRGKKVDNGIESVKEIVKEFKTIAGVLEGILLSI